jgi:hypothetical protein
MANGLKCLSADVQARAASVVGEDDLDIVWTGLPES